MNAASLILSPPAHTIIHTCSNSHTHSHTHTHTGTHTQPFAEILYQQREELSDANYFSSFLTYTRTQLFKLELVPPHSVTHSVTVHSLTHSLTHSVAVHFLHRKGMRQMELLGE